MGQAFALRRHSAGGSNGILIREARESRNPYPGDLSFEAVYTGTGYRLYVIAHIFIETYLYGVLPYEMGNSSHAEALKAQAVAARTYTVRMMKSRASGRYDVQDTTSDQVYRGTPSGNANCVAAVDETKGIVLMYGGNYITTFYSSSNGGQTEIPRNGTSYGYMKVKDDPFDYDNPSSTVKSKTIYADLQSSANSSQLIALLKEKAIRSLQRSGYAATHENTFHQTLKAVTPHTPMYAEPSKLYTQMDFTMDVQTRTSSGLIATLTVAVTCDIFDELESVLAMGIQSMDNELWTVARSGSGFVLQARRYGHGMGMSQRGAMYMAKQGYTYDQILGFYYEGCTRVQHSFTSSILDPDTDDENITVEPPADLEETGSTGRVQLGSSESVLFIRSQKSYSAQVIGTASHGAQLKVLSNDGNWCFVRFGALDGYVPSASLLISGTPEETDTGATPIAGFVRVTANDFVNLRQSGSMSARITGTAPAGAILTLFETNGSWAKVQYNGLAAYANTGYLSSVMPHYPSSAEDEVATGTAVVSTADGGSVNLREQASLGSRVLTQVPYGAQVELLSEYGKWHKIRYQGWTGYMMSRFLLAKNEDENKPVPPDTVEGERAIVATEYGSLNMRARASAGSEILTTIPKGAYVVVEQHGDVWSAVWYEGWAGYVMTCYLAFENEEEQPEVSPQLQYATVHTPSGTLNLRALPRTGSQILGQIPPGTRVTVYEYASDWCRVNYNGTVGYVMTLFLRFGEQEEETEDEAVAYATVNTPGGPLNLRTSASTYAGVVTQIPQYASVSIYARGESWCEVGYEGYRGFAMTSYLAFDGTQAPETERTAYVYTASGGLNLRNAPNTFAGLVTTIPRLAEVTIVSYGADWCEIRYGLYEGYGMTRFLSFEKPQESPDSGKPDEQEAVDVWVYTESGSLNLRAEPSATAELVTFIPRGAKAKMLMEGNEWSYVTYNGDYGYAMTRYLRANDPFEAPKDVYAYTMEDIAVWPTKTESGSPLGYIPAGAEIRILFSDGAWRCVEYGSLQGYCTTDALSVME